VESGERFGYEVIGGLRVRGYQATVTLEDGPAGGTTIRWRSTYEHAGPLTALMLRLAVREACRRSAKAVSASEVDASDRRAAP
jgi:hypothetical protein